MKLLVEPETHFNQPVVILLIFINGQENPCSDIDILVSFSRDIDPFDFINLRNYLEAKLRAKVDLVMASALKPAIGRRILEEVQYF